MNQDFDGSSAYKVQVFKQKKYDFNHYIICKVLNPDVSIYDYTYDKDKFKLIVESVLECEGLMTERTAASTLLQ